MNSFLRLSIVFTLLFVANHGYGQQSTDTTLINHQVRIVMKNGDEFMGILQFMDKDSLVLSSINGEFHLISTNVKRIQNESYTGKYNFPSTHYTRYFFGPSAIPLEKKHGYYQNVLLSTNLVNYGLSKNVSVGGGIEFISTVLGQPAWCLTPKMGFKVANKVHVGGGVMFAAIVGEGMGTLPYGVVTYGTKEANVTAGFGMLKISEDFEWKKVFTLNGTYRVSKSIGLLSENYLVPDPTGRVSYYGIQGIRLLSEKNSFDIGAIVIPEIFQDIPALPFVGYARSF